MHKLLKTFFLISLLFSLTCLGNAQENPTNPDAPKVETTYDQEKNETQVELTKLPISVDNAKMAYLSVSVTYKGKKIAKPDDVIFIVQVVSTGGPKYPQINNVKLSSNGKSLGEIVMLNLDQRKFTETEVLETIGTRIKFEIFKKVTASSKVIFTIGGSYFQINEAQLIKMGEFEKVINP